MAAAALEIRGAVALAAEGLRAWIRGLIGAVRTETVRLAVQGGLKPGAALSFVSRELLRGVEGLFSGHLRALDATWLEATSQGFVGGLVETAGVEARLAWRTISSSPCPDCRARHGDVATVAEWRRIGMPGTRWPPSRQHPVCSVAVIRCKCVLVPGDAPEVPIIEREPDPARPGRTIARLK